MVTGIDLCTKGKTIADWKKRQVIKQFTGSGNNDAGAHTRCERVADERMRRWDSGDLNCGLAPLHPPCTTMQVTALALVYTPDWPG